MIYHDGLVTNQPQYALKTHQRYVLYNILSIIMLCNLGMNFSMELAVPQNMQTRDPFITTCTWRRKTLVWSRD